jgi:hypothetical protein
MSSRIFWKRISSKLGWFEIILSIVAEAYNTAADKLIIEAVNLIDNESILDMGVSNTHKNWVVRIKEGIWR